MGKYTVVVSKFESMTVEVEADNMPSAYDVGLEEARACWEADTENWQVDDVREIVTVPATDEEEE